MHVAAEPAILAADHHGDLAMRLDADQPVHHMDAGLLEGARPGDVGLLVHAGLQLHRAVTCLPFSAARWSAARWGCRVLFDRASADGEHVWIVRCRVDEGHHRVE